MKPWTRQNMAGELERLLIRLEADTTLLRRAMKDAESGVGAFESKAKSGFDRVEKRYQQAGATLETAMKRVAAAIAATATVSAAWDATKHAAAIEGLAKSAGLSTDAFQGLRNQAASTGVEFDRFGAASNQFAEKMAELRTRTGDLYEFLRNSAPALDRQLAATKTQGDAYGVLGRFISDMAREEEKALVVKKAFGDASPDFIAALEKMGDAYRTTGKAAADFKDNISKEAIDGAKALKAEVDNIGRALTSSFQEATGPLAGWLAKVLAQMRTDVSSFASYAKSLGTDSSNFAFGGDPLKTAVATGAIKLQAAAIGEWTTKVEKAKNIRLEQKLPPWQTSVDTSVADKMSALRNSAAQARGEDFDSIRQETEQQIEEIRRMMTNDITGRLNDEAEFAEAKVLINEAAGKRILDLNHKLIDEDRARFAEFENLFKGSIGGAIDEAVRTGKVSWANLVTDMLAGIAKITTEMLILKPIMDSVFSAVRGSSLGSSFFNMSTSNSGFGGGRAAGGPVLGGVPHLVGERGPELFVPNTSGTVVPSGSFGGGGGGTTVYQIDARGSDISVAARVEAAIAAARMGQRDPARAVADQRRQFPNRAAA